MSGYQQALEAAGANVIAFEQFGSYQGEWFALVEFNGERGWVNGGYGSCTGCDSFEAEFGYDFSGTRVGPDYVYPGDERHPRHAEYQTKLADFGKGYLDGLLTQEAAEKAAAENLSWDSDAAAMLAWVKSYAEAA